MQQDFIWQNIAEQIKAAGGENFIFGVGGIFSLIICCAFIVGLFAQYTLEHSKNK